MVRKISHNFWLIINYFKLETLILTQVFKLQDLVSLVKQNILILRVFPDFRKLVVKLPKLDFGGKIQQNSERNYMIN